MSDDKRENILARVFTIMGTVPGIETTRRNMGMLTTDKRPAMVLLDGDEIPRLSVDTNRIKGRQALLAPQIISCRPEVYILLKEARPNTEETGTQLNAFRIAFFEKLWADETLAGLLGSNGTLVYYGCETDLKSGSAMSGQMRLDFVMNYPFIPT
jgi:hypothetical protein